MANDMSGAWLAMGAVGAVALAGVASASGSQAKKARSLSTISFWISRNWKDPYFGAVPYIEAMKYLDDVHDYYGDDSGARIVAGFLANANTWKGEDARKIKEELKLALKAPKVHHKIPLKNRLSGDV